MFGGDLPLRQRLVSAQAIAELQDLALAVIQAGVHVRIHLLIPVAQFDPVQLLIFTTDDIHQRQGITVAIAVQCFGQRNFTRGPPPGAKVH